MELQHLLQRCKSHLTENIACDLFLEIELMIIAFATGIMDAVTFPDYHVFASNQTGNTALLAVGALGLGDGIVALRDVGLSLGAFVAGGLICGQIGNSAGPMRRAWLLASNFVQTALVFTAAALHTRAESASVDLGIIAVLAFASGAQVASARTVHVPEVTTAMVTSAYIDFLVDPEILKKHNRSRNRRLFFVACLLFGSFIGAISYRYVSAALALFLSAASKAIVCVALIFNPGEHPEKNQD